jgi:hypothetical protein
MGAAHPPPNAGGASRFISSDIQSGEFKTSDTSEEF